MPRSIDPSACFFTEGEDIVRGKGHFIVTEHLPADGRTGSRFPLLLTTGRILSQYNAGAQARRTANVVWHEEDAPEIHPHDALKRGICERVLMRLARRPGETALRAHVIDRVAPGAGDATFNYSETQGTVVTTDYSDRATNGPEYEVSAVQVSPTDGPSEWQVQYRTFSETSRRIKDADLVAAK
jgi:formate dehydrogenase major subunit